jgi:glycosyltransferase A (GT-A) superfamily protein (DUF2064 family)
MLRTVGPRYVAGELGDANMRLTLEIAHARGIELDELETLSGIDRPAIMELLDLEA